MYYVHLQKHLSLVYKKYTNMIEMIQRRAARFTLHNYHNTSSVTDMMHQLGWEQLSCRRKRADLINFYKVQFSLVAVPLPSIVIRPQRQHTHHFLIPYCSTEAYKQSFFPRVIREWNALPPSIVSGDGLPAFKAALTKLSL